MNKKNIIFIGDSYGSAYDPKGATTPLYQGHHGSTDCHPDLVVDYFDATMLNFCYGGKSWWYSRVKFMEYFQQHPEILDDNIAVIFFHTDWGRVNNACNDEITQAHHSAGRAGKKRSDNLETAMQYYFAYLEDRDFQRWAQTQWFKEIKKIFKNKKIINFTCFDDLLEEKKRILPGTFFSTPLIEISIGELTGSEKQILHQISAGEDRNNHLNEYNNRALASVIIDAIENYVPEVKKINLSKFDIKNPNAANWPHGKYWTK